MWSHDFSISNFQYAVPLRERYAIYRPKHVFRKSHLTKQPREDEVVAQVYELID